MKLKTLINLFCVSILLCLASCGEKISEKDFEGHWQVLLLDEDMPNDDGSIMHLRSVQNLIFYPDRVENSYASYIDGEYVGEVKVIGVWKYVRGDFDNSEAKGVITCNWDMSTIRETFTKYPYFSGLEADQITALYSKGWKEWNEANELNAGTDNVYGFNVVSVDQDRLVVDSQQGQVSFTRQ